MLDIGATRNGLYGNVLGVSYPDNPLRFHPIFFSIFADSGVFLWLFFNGEDNLISDLQSEHTYGNIRHRIQGDFPCNVF